MSRAVHKLGQDPSLILKILYIFQKILKKIIHNFKFLIDFLNQNPSPKEILIKLLSMVSYTKVFQFCPFPGEASRFNYRKVF